MLPLRPLRPYRPALATLFGLCVLGFGVSLAAQTAPAPRVLTDCSDPIVFADVLLEFDPECFLRDLTPEGALGPDDYDGSPLSVDQFAFLGDGGRIKLGFTDNVLTNSGDAAPDLYVYEIGPAVEACDVALRPLDAATLAVVQGAGLADPDGDGYYDIGRIAGAVTTVDIDALLPPLPPGELQFDAIEIRDVVDRGCTSLTPGADIDAVCALSVLVYDCAGTLNGTAEIDACGLCLEPTDPAFGQSCLDCAGVPFGTSTEDACGLCLPPDDPSRDRSCADCAGVPNGTATLDACGVCLQPDDPSRDQSCADCAGVPNGAATLDACGVCLPPDDPSRDRSCADCAGVPNGMATLDACGVCLPPDDPARDQSCADCAGVPNGESVVDSCGVCLPPASLGFNASCTDCAGTVNGTARLDSCGVCLPPNDPAFGQACAQSREVFVPTAFSPNADGLNDWFGLFVQRAEGVVVEEFRVFDRWGTEVFRAVDVAAQRAEALWDGTIGGREAAPGVYAYLIVVRFPREPGRAPLTLHGDVTLLR